jgi:hypothetical protein
MLVAELEYGICIVIGDAIQKSHNAEYLILRLGRVRMVNGLVKCSTVQTDHGEMGHIALSVQWKTMIMRKANWGVSSLGMLF